MSRCFPFPPPGYDKRATSHRIDLLEKAKHKEKKHKKEKRDKEKKEGKEKRDKDRSKDKHKEKKDRKEKRRDKKKDNDRDKDKSRTSEERNRKQTESHHEERFGESSWIAKEIKDSKFVEELGRRIREEKRAANQLVENFSMVERSLESFSAAPAMEKKSVTINKIVPNSIGTHLERSLDELRAGPAAEREKITANKMVPSSISTAQKRNDEVRQQINNASISAQKKSEGLGSDTAMQKERVTITAGQRQNGGASQSAQIPTGSTQRKLWSPTAAGTERGTHNKIITNPGGAVQRTNDGMGQPPERFSSFIQRKIEDPHPTTAMEKEKENGNRMLLLMEHGRNDAMAQYVEKNAGRAIQGRETGKERETDEGRREKDSNRHRDEKKKRKDKHKLKKKKKEEKIKEKSEDKPKEHNELRDNPRSNQTNGLNINPLAHHNDDGKNAGSDANVKKRKDFETNGLLHEHDMRPTKFPRMTPSNLPVENGGTLLLPYHVAAPCSSVKPDAIFNVKAEKLLDNKEKKINGIPEAQRPPSELRLPISTVSSGNGEVSMRPPHPDSKYLTQVYSVPKMGEWPEPEDQEWLFIRGQLRSEPKAKLEADGIPQVWDEALHIESADVIALPYVIPF